MSECPEKIQSCFLILGSDPFIWWSGMCKCLSCSQGWTFQHGALKFVITRFVCFLFSPSDSCRVESSFSVAEWCQRSQNLQKTAIRVSCWLKDVINQTTRAAPSWRKLFWCFESSFSQQLNIFKYIWDKHSGSERGNHTSCTGWCGFGQPCHPWNDLWPLTRCVLSHRTSPSYS